MSRPTRHSGGFGIVELVISLVMLTVTITTFMTISQTTQRLNLRHAYLTQALAAGEQVTEELLMKGTSDADLSAGSHSRYFDRRGRETTAGAHVYEVIWTVKPWATVPGVLQVEINVQWQGPDNLEEVRWTTWRQ